LTKIDLNKYKEFVQKVTSDESNDNNRLYGRMGYLSGFAHRVSEDKVQNEAPINIALLLTGGIGLSSETGEFNEIIKKVLFQGKPWNEDVRFHLKRELGDILWYWVNSCRALDLDPNEVVAENVEKLKARYPGGEFDVFYSENRKEGDL
jgi:NTP pyrophosphatase (non-canonical NTP hydrolase)